MVEQFPDAPGEGQLAAGVAAVPARGPLRRDRPRCIEGAQEGLLHPQRFGGPPGGIRRVVGVVQPVRVLCDGDARNAYGYRNTGNQCLRTCLATTRRSRGCLEP
jgi:hypothetical protein